MDNTGKKSKEDKAFNIMEKVLTELKRDDTKELFMNIMERMLEFIKINYPTDAKLSILKMEVVVMFLDLMLRNVCVHHYNDVFQALEYFFMPRELRIIAQHKGIQECSLLDEGDYGKVYVGTLVKSCDVLLVAVKVAKDNPNDVLLQEAKVLARLDHKNVVKILAFQKNPSKIAMEFMEGNLHDAVQSHRFNNADILKAIHEVALGMAYIAEKKYIHRDLDARNIFVDSKRVCKVGDFGYARYVGYCTNGEITEKLPIELMYLMAPESTINSIFSTKTDVWGFGCLILRLYDTAEDACRDEVERRRRESFALLITQGILKFPRPMPCPEKLFRYTSEELLNRDPRRRPHFSAVEKRIEEILSSTA